MYSTKEVTFILKLGSLELLEQLKAEEIIREEQLPNEYRNLYKRGHILSDFWIAAAQTQGNEITLESIDSYFQIMAQGFYPYLTEKEALFI